MPIPALQEMIEEVTSLMSRTTARALTTSAAPTPLAQEVNLPLATHSVAMHDSGLQGIDNEQCVDVRHSIVIRLVQSTIACSK